VYSIDKKVVVVFVRVSCAAVPCGVFGCNPRYSTTDLGLKGKTFYIFLDSSIIIWAFRLQSHFINLKTLDNALTGNWAHALIFFQLLFINPYAHDAV
jgi:hypothetical protein